MKPPGRLCLMALALIVMPIPTASAITIVTHFIGGAPPPNAAGGGNLVDIFNAAARRWELAFSDEFTITLYFGWATLGDSGIHTPVELDADQHREIAGTILFDNSGAISFFLDPTPFDDKEFRRRSDEYQDLGAGFVNVARLFSQPVGDASGRCDLLSVALHEIGHSLGLSAGNTGFMDAARDGGLVIAPDLPFAGMVVPLASNYSGVVSHFDVTKVVYGSVMSGVNSDERRIPSALDILANAQVSHFKSLNLNQMQDQSSFASARTGRSVPGNATGSHGN